MALSKAARSWPEGGARRIFAASLAGPGLLQLRRPGPVRERRGIAQPIASGDGDRARSNRRATATIRPRKRTQSLDSCDENEEEPRPAWYHPQSILVRR